MGIISGNHMWFYFWDANWPLYRLVYLLNVGLNWMSVLDRKMWLSSGLPRFSWLDQYQHWTRFLFDVRNTCSLSFYLTRVVLLFAILSLIWKLDWVEWFLTFALSVLLHDIWDHMHAGLVCRTEGTFLGALLGVEMIARGFYMELPLHPLHFHVSRWRLGPPWSVSGKTASGGSSFTCKTATVIIVRPVRGQWLGTAVTVETWV
jgi:hypothetical protein